MDEERIEKLRQEALLCYREGLAAQAGGNYEEAEKAHGRCLQLMRASGNRNGEAAALHQLGTLVEARADFHEARSHFLESYALFSAEGDDQNRLFSLFSQGILAFKAGEPGDGVQLLLQSVELAFQLSPMMIQEAWSRVRQGVGILFAGRGMEDLLALGEGLTEMSQSVLKKHTRDGPFTQFARATSEMGSLYSSCAQVWLGASEDQEEETEDLRGRLLQTAVNLDQVTGGAMAFTDLAAKALFEHEMEQESAA